MSVSAILPVSLHEKGASDRYWRKAVSENASLHLDMLLKTLAARLERNLVRDIFVVYPDNEAETIANLIDPYRRDLDLVPMSESAYFKEAGILVASVERLSGWEIQQIIKLGFSRITMCDYYLTLDCDIMAINSIGRSSLFCPDGRSIIGSESESDFGLLYVPEFAKTVIRIKQDRYQASRIILGSECNYDEAVFGRSLFMSETPVLMSTVWTSRMISFIERSRRANFADVLSCFDGWTEYGLYSAWIDMHPNLIGEIHSVRNRNAILFLDGSVWEPTRVYRKERDYPRDILSSRSAPFVAIQSWIPTKEWLPSRYPNLAAFFAELGAKLSSSP